MANEQRIEILIAAKANIEAEIRKVEARLAKMALTGQINSKSIKGVNTEYARLSSILGKMDKPLKEINATQSKNQRELIKNIRQRGRLLVSQAQAEFRANQRNTQDKLRNDIADRIFKSKLAREQLAEIRKRGAFLVKEAKNEFNSSQAKLRSDKKTAEDLFFFTQGINRKQENAANAQASREFTVHMRRVQQEAKNRQKEADKLLKKQEQDTKKQTRTEEQANKNRLKGLRYFGYSLGAIPWQAARYGLLAIAGYIVKMGLEWTNARQLAINSLTITTGSIDTATKAYTAFNMAAVGSPFLSQDVEAAGQSFVQMGMSVQDSVRWVNTLNDAVARTGDISSESYNKAAGSIAQMQETGMISGNLPPGAITALAKSRGTSNFAVSKSLQARAGTPAQGLLNELGPALNAQDHGASSLQAQSLGGRLNQGISALQMGFNQSFNGAFMPSKESVLSQTLHSTAGTGVLGQLASVFLPHFASGGTSSGGTALVGEKGPELVNLPKGAQVTPNSSIATMLSKGNPVSNIKAISSALAQMRLQSFMTSVGFGVQFAQISSTITNLSPIIIKNLSATWTKITTDLQTDWAIITKFLSDTWTSIQGTAQAAGNTLSNFFGGIWNGIKTTASSIWSSISSTVTSIVSGLPGSISSFINSIPGILANIWQSIWITASQWWTYIVTGITYITGQLPTDIWNWISSIPGTLYGIWQNIWTDASNAWNSITILISSIIGNLPSDIWTFISNIPSMIYSIWGNIYNGAVSAWQSITDTVGYYTGQVWNVIVDTINNIIPTLQGIWDSIWTDTQTAWGAIGDVINGIMSSIGDDINSFVTMIKNISIPIPNVSVNWGDILNGIMPSVGVGINWETIGQIAGLANGGTLTSGGSVLVGERGPEILNLPSGASVNPNINGGSGGGTTHVHLEGAQIYGFDDLENMLISAINKASRRGRIQGLQTT